MSNPVIAGLETLKMPTGMPALCLVTGATGYIGGRLVPELLDLGYRVRVMVRDASRVSQHPWFSKVEIVDGDAEDPAALDRALAGVDVAYYLIHSLLVKDNFEDSEIRIAKQFGEHCATAKVKRIIYPVSYTHLTLPTICSV